LFNYLKDVSYSQHLQNVKMIDSHFRLCL